MYVAEKFQQMILTKSVPVVLVKKKQCHRYILSQIRESINAFKMANKVAELRITGTS